MNYGPITTGEGMKFKAQIGDLKCSGSKSPCEYSNLVIELYCILYFASSKSTLTDLVKDSNMTAITNQ